MLVAQGVLHSAHGILHGALGLVGLAFALGLLVAGQVADRFLHLARLLLDGAFHSILVHVVLHLRDWQARSWRKRAARRSRSALGSTLGQTQRVPQLRRGGRFLMLERRTREEHCRDGGRGELPRLDVARIMDTAR